MNDPSVATIAAAVSTIMRTWGRASAAARVVDAGSTSELHARLAAENLGFVPIADPASFEWAGHWMAIVDDAGVRDVVVMFGSPSAPVWPARYVGRHDLQIVGGRALAPLDPALPADAPHGVDRGTVGSVVGLFVAARAGGEMERRERVSAVAGRGLLGDRYGDGQGTFSGPTGYHLTLVDAGAGALVADDLPTGDLRRNIVTNGIVVEALVGVRFRVGEALLAGRRPCEPCRRLEEVVGRALIGPLVHRAGLRADVLEGGTIAVGDAVTPVPS